MAELDFEGDGLIYVNQNLCSYCKVFWSWSKMLHNMVRIYNWYGSGCTITIKHHEHGDSVSVTHIDDFIKDFPSVNFTTFYNR